MIKYIILFLFHINILSANVELNNLIKYANETLPKTINNITIQKVKLNDKTIKYKFVFNKKVYIIDDASKLNTLYSVCTIKMMNILKDNYLLHYLYYNKKNNIVGEYKINYNDCNKYNKEYFIKKALIKVNKKLPKEINNNMIAKKIIIDKKTIQYRYIIKNMTHELFIKKKLKNKLININNICKNNKNTQKLLSLNYILKYEYFNDNDILLYTYSVKLSDCKK